MKTSKEIKFRGWNTEAKVMYSSEEMGADQLTVSTDGRGFVNVSGDSTKLSQFYKHILPLRFTGYYDMDGKEIYEGDLLHYKGHQHTSRKKGQIHEVYWDLERGAWKTRPQYEGGQINRLFNSVVQNNHSVCGNIYQNPELVINHEKEA